MESKLQRPVRGRVNVGPLERGFSLASGMALLAHIITRRTAYRLPLALEAAYLIYRGATGHCLFYSLVGIDRGEVDGHEGIRVEREVTVRRPKEELYHTWRDFENLPRFMAHLESVRVDAADEGRSHWVARGPLERRVEWESEVIEERENELLVWKSLPGSTVESMGRVAFDDTADGSGTVVRVSMEYNPPGGSLGAAFARLFGEDPDLQIQEDLERFKQLMEGEDGRGETVPGTAKPNGRQATRKRPAKDLVEQASEDSFPASDPPGWISERGIR